MRRAMSAADTNGHDAICFTAGAAGGPFGAGVLHAYLAADRDSPCIAAGISLGAVNAAAFQQAYQELDPVRPRAGCEGPPAAPAIVETARWRWFRRYLRVLANEPLKPIWDGLPDQSDFFADMQPIRDPATPSTVRGDESEALHHRYLLVQLGRWLARLPIKARLFFLVLIRYVRWKEHYPGRPRWLFKTGRSIAFGITFSWLVMRLLKHMAANKWVPLSPEAEAASDRWLKRPLFKWLFVAGWTVRLAVYAMAVAVAIVLDDVGVKPGFDLGFPWLGALPWLGAILEPWRSSITRMAIWYVVAFVVVLLVLGVVVPYSLAGRRRAGKEKLRPWLFRATARTLGLNDGLIHEFHLKLELLKLFGRDGIDRTIGDGRVTLVLVAAPLQALPRQSLSGGTDATKIPAYQVWFTDKALLVESLIAALALPGIFRPKELADGRPATWLGQDPKLDRVQLVDGATIRQNPLPALFNFLKRQRPLADELIAADDRTAPAVHVVYTVPIVPAQGDGTLAEERANVVDVARASLEVSRRRDTQVEVQQTNFITELEATIRAINGATSGTLPLHVDSIAPERDFSFANPLAPTPDEVLTAAASGCRRTLETIYHQELAARIGHGRIHCATFLRAVAVRRRETIETASSPGLPEVCQRCTGYLAGPPHPGRRADGRLDEPTDATSMLGPQKDLALAFPQLDGTRPRIIFVASGGVFRGAFHIGMIAALRVANVAPDLIVGASVGTLIGGVLAAVMRADEARAGALLRQLVGFFEEVDARVALTLTLKTASRELGLRGKEVRLSPNMVRRMVARGGRADAGYAATGAPPALIDALRDFFIIPYAETSQIAARFVAGDVSEATHRFLTQLKDHTLERLKISHAVMGSSLLEQRMVDLFTAAGDAVDLHASQPFQRPLAGRPSIAFFGTTTNLGTRAPLLLGNPATRRGEPYDAIAGMLASSAFPAVFEPRRESELFPGHGQVNVRYADGGMFDNLPFLPAIEILSHAQADHLRRTGEDSFSALARRRDEPDLIIAGSLDARPEDDDEPGQWYEDLFSIRERATKLKNNVKIRAFERASERVDRQIHVLLEAWRASGTSPNPRLVHGAVNAAVLPVFPADEHHLNGTFAFCASTGLDSARVRQSIADGCYQTLTALARSSSGTDLLSRALRGLRRRGRVRRLVRMPFVDARPDECPFFAREGAPFTCPFAETPTGANGDQSALGVRKACVGDRAHRD